MPPVPLLGEIALRNGAHAERVAEDVRSGAQSGVPSTPGFFVNGMIHLGSPTSTELGEAIASEIPSKIIDPE